MVVQPQEFAQSTLPGESLVDKEGNAFTLRQRDCPTCGASPQRLIGVRGGRWHRYGLGVATRIVQCQRCRLVFPNPFPYPVNPQKLYGDPSKYFEARDTRSSQQHRIHGCRKLVRHIKAWVRAHECSLLDVGSGRGELLAAAQLEGLTDVVGLEFAQAMIDHVWKRYHIALVPQTIEQYATAHHRTFDAIVLNAVLEHVHDPDAMIAACAALTRPGGLLYIDIPNEPNLMTVAGNMLNRMRGSPAVFNLSPTWIPYHVFGFNPHALGRLLKKHGFNVMRVRIHAAPVIPATSDTKDQWRAFIATQICRLANLTGTASNMYVWARRAS